MAQLILIQKWYIATFCQLQNKNVGLFVLIQARIKAKPLIRNYDSRNGYIKRMAPPPQPSGQMPTDVITSSAPPPQFTATPPFSLMPNPQISQYHLNGQQVREYAWIGGWVELWVDE